MEVENGLTRFRLRSPPHQRSGQWFEAHVRVKGTRSVVLPSQYGREGTAGFPHGQEDMPEKNHRCGEIAFPILRDFWRGVGMFLCTLEGIRCTLCGLAVWHGITVNLSSASTPPLGVQRVLILLYVSAWWGPIAIGGLASQLFRQWSWRERFSLCVISSYGIWLNALTWQVAHLPERYKAGQFLLAGLLHGAAVSCLWSLRRSRKADTF